MKRLPDFLIAGVMKGGTTALYEALCEHPQVWARQPKEIHYFSTHYERGPEWYAQFFQDCPTGQLTGEASPSYFDGCLAYPVLERLQAVAPNLPCIIVLRDPVSRAISQFHHLRRYEASFDRAQTLAEFFAPAHVQAVAQGVYDDLPIHLPSTINNGLYRQKMARWLQAMPNTLVLTQTQLQDPRQNMALSQRLCAHLGLKTVLLPFSEHGAMKGAYSPPPEGEAWRLALQEFYAEEYAWLAEQGWLTPSPSQEAFDNRQFWNSRYQNPDLDWLGSGPGSRGLAAHYKGQLIQNTLAQLGAQSILDAGCGDGCWLPQLPEHVRYHGLDIADAAITRLQQHYPQHQFSCMDLRQQDWPSGLDLVVCLDVLIHQDTRASLDALLDRLLAASTNHALVSYFSPEADGPVLPDLEAGLEAGQADEARFQQTRQTQPHIAAANTAFFGDLPRLIAARPQGRHWEVQAIGRYRFQTVYQLRRRPAPAAVIKGRAYIVGGYGPQGGTYMAYQIGRLLARLGHEVWVVDVDGEAASRHDSERAFFNYPEDFPVCSLPSMLMQASAYDVLVCNPSFSKLDLGLRWPGRSLCYVQNVRTFQVLDRYFERYVSVSPWVQNFLRQYYSLDTPVLPAFVNLQRFHADGAPTWQERDPSWLILDYKNHERLLDKLQLWLQAHGLHLPLKVLPRMSQTELAHNLRQHRFYLSLAAMEGFGLPLLEAMACGMACVGWDAGGSQLYTRDEGNCLLARYGDIPGLGRQVARLLLDPTFGAPLAAQGQVTALGFSENLFDLQWANYLQDWLSQPKVET